MVRVILAALLFLVIGCVHEPWRKVPRGRLATEHAVIEAEDKSFKLTAGELFKTPFRSDCPDEATPDNYAECDEGGGKRVRVTTSAHDQPLYGVLCLCNIHPDYNGPVSRSYEISVPDKYVAETAGGLMSVVNEYYQNDGHTYNAWILWLSRDPIPGGERQNRPPRSTTESVSPAPTGETTSPAASTETSSRPLGVSESSDTSEPVETPLGPRARRRFFIGGEMGWNSLSGTGATFSFRLLPNIAFDAGLGFSWIGLKVGLRGRYNFLVNSPWSPTVGAGLMLGSGLPNGFFGLKGGTDQTTRYYYSVAPSPVFQLVGGAEYLSNNGFTVLITGGLALALTDNIVVASTGRPPPEGFDRGPAGTLHGGGPVVAVAVGKSF